LFTCIGNRKAGKVRAHLLAMVIAVSQLALHAGCASQDTTHEYHTVLPSTLRSAEHAKTCNERGLTLVEAGKLDEAEGAFREALLADIGYAAAHNNLGLILLEQGRFYEAALEFDQAKRLAPQAVEPIVNLARLYEAVGWTKLAKEERERAALLAAETRFLANKR